MAIPPPCVDHAVLTTPTRRTPHSRRGSAFSKPLVHRSSAPASSRDPQFVDPRPAPRAVEGATPGRGSRGRGRIRSTLMLRRRCRRAHTCSTVIHRSDRLDHTGNDPVAADAAPSPCRAQFAYHQPSYRRLSRSCTATDLQLHGDYAFAPCRSIPGVRLGVAERSRWREHLILRQRVGGPSSPGCKSSPRRQDTSSRRATRSR